MRRNKRLLSFLAILCSVLLLVQTVQVAFAKKGKRATLSLKSTEINASVIDSSKNRLVIPDATGFSTTVVIKPSKRTLKNAKPVKVEGTINDNGELEVDLSALGPANLIPSGKYLIKAKKGRKNLKAVFNYNAPTLIVGNLVVPVPDPTGEIAARIIRYQTTGETPETSEDIPDAEVFLTDNNHKPIDVPTLQVPGAETLDEDGNPVRSYQLISEIPNNLEIPNAVLKAQVEAPSSTGEDKEVTLSTVVFTEDAQNENHVLPDVEVNAATHAATNIVTAAKTELEDIAPDLQIIPLMGTFKAALEATDAADNAGNTVDEALDAATAALAINSNKIYEELFNDVTSTKELKKDIEKISEEATEVAANIAWKAPEIAKRSADQLVRDEDGNNPVDDIPYDTFAAGFFDSTRLEMSAPPSSKVEAAAYKAANVVPGSLMATPEAIEAAIMSGTLPPFDIEPKAAEKLAEIRKAFEEFTPGELEDFNPDELGFPIPPGVRADLATLGPALKDAASMGGFIPFFEAAPGSFPTGDFFDEEIEFEAHPGAFLPPSLAGTAKPPMGAFMGTFPPAFIPPSVGMSGMVTAGFVPPSFADFFEEDFDIFAGEGAGPVSTDGLVFSLSTGRGTPPPPPSGEKLAAFDPSVHAAVVEEAFAELGGDADFIFGMGATALAGAFTRGPAIPPPPGAGPLGPTLGPAGLFGLAGMGLDAFGPGFGPPIPPPGFEGEFGPGPFAFDEVFGPDEGGFDIGMFTGSGADLFMGPPPGAMGGMAGMGFPGGGATGGEFPGGGATGSEFPPGGFQPGEFPPGEFPPGEFPPGEFPPGGFPPGEFPPGDGFQPPPGGQQPPPGGDGQQPPPGGDGQQPPPPDGEFQPPPPDGGQPPPPDGEFQPPPPDGGQPPPPDGGQPPPPDGGQPPPPPPEGEPPPPPPPEEPPPPPPPQ